MREKRIVNLVQAIAEKRGQERLRPLVAEDIAVELPDQSTPRCGIRLPSPEPPDLGLLEDVVPPKHLIGSFAGEDNLQAAVPHRLRQHQQRHGRRAQDRLLGMPEHLGK